MTQRVLTLLLYLAQRYRSVTMSSLISGHSFLTTAGRPSLFALGGGPSFALPDHADHIHVGF